LNCFCKTSVSLFNAGDNTTLTKNSTKKFTPIKPTNKSVTKLSAATPSCPATPITSSLIITQPRANKPVFAIGAEMAATMLATKPLLLPRHLIPLIHLNKSAGITPAAAPFQANYYGHKWVCLEKVKGENILTHNAPKGSNRAKGNTKCQAAFPAQEHCAQSNWN